VWACGVALIGLSNAGHAVNFDDASYDSNTDELVIVVNFGGASPNHQFSLAWDTCIDMGDGRHTIGAALLDAQFQEPARQDYTKTLRMSLAAMNCRPATVTLHAIPNFNIAVDVPERAARNNAP
jgi:hypothetical protein